MLALHHPFFLLLKNNGENKEKEKVESRNSEMRNEQRQATSTYNKEVVSSSLSKSKVESSWRKYVEFLFGNSLSTTG